MHKGHSFSAQKAGITCMAYIELSRGEYVKVSLLSASSQNFSSIFKINYLTETIGIVKFLRKLGITTNNMIKNAKSKRVIILVSSIILFLIILTSLILYHNVKSTDDIKEETFSKLRSFRKQKKDEVINYYNTLMEKASGIKRDSFMVNSFNRLRNFSVNNINHHFDELINKHYVAQYSDFYDILFVDHKGFIFHSIKKESDYYKNIFEDHLFSVDMSKHLKKKSKDIFIEYETYMPSDEPAGFFVVPINSEGWLFLQFSINHLNTMLSTNEDLGNTGEIYLVNSKKLMLSKSRFMEDSTILKIKIDTLAVKEAKLKKKGERIIKDYRGQRVFSSYEKFDIFNSSWIIIAEIDESEIITEYYKKHKRYLLERIIKYLANKSSNETFMPKQNTYFKRVDMNEFHKGLYHESLASFGLSHCTGIAILYPDKFRYITHITPTDWIYNKNSLVKFFLGDKSTNFLNELTKRIIYYNVYQSELANLKFVITACHTKSIENAVDIILENKIPLSNITFCYNPKATRADIHILKNDNSVYIKWLEKNRIITENSNDYENMESIVKKIIDY